MQIKSTYLVIIGILIGLLGFFLLLANPFGWKMITPTLTNPSTTTDPQNPKYQAITGAPTPVLVLPKGKQTYFVRGGDKEISRISSITIDPLDITKNSEQTMTIKMTSKEDISDFKATLVSDNTKQTFSLNLISGDLKNGTWEAKYKVTDNTDKKYGFDFKIITINGNETATVFPVR